ncbi:hypothetical protein [Ferruginibacter sp.]|uniref:hypothetical protein n=1 Tax=Ferruginibacter sp. TaxID=1940288 RepID=UPI0019B840BF|nr:hypothetical protein [Ferruginibacter sp.]MBC7629014.1 hypothetical protein [Ferruginibacter sp.]
MKREIKIFKSFEEQEKYFLEYFFYKTPSERLKALADLQKLNNKDFLIPSQRKITIQKHFRWT